MIYERISGYARSGMVGLGESAVDYEQLAVGAHRTLSLRRPHRHVAVDDMAVLTLHSERVEDTVDHRLVVAQLIVVALLLGVGRGVLDEVALESVRRMG